jgi:SAM-dependent methyltransferase
MYHKYYDTVYQDYDYALDVDFLNGYCTSHHLQCSNLLEVGCGTGRHTALLANHSKSVFAIDNDPHMIEVARQYILKRGITNVNFLCLSALDLKKCGLSLCDISCSLFNVINYVLDYDSLMSFFTAISATMTPSGIFLLDCLDSGTKYNNHTSAVFTYLANDQKLTRTIESAYNPDNQTLLVKENYLSLSEENECVHTFKLWSREQIEQAAKLAGFKINIYSKKQNINSDYKKQNQVMFLMEKEA